MLDFCRLNRNLPARQVLAELGLVPTYVHGREWRAGCPIHRSQSKSSRTFDFDLDLNRWHCHKCHATGDLIDLWAALRGLSVYDAAWQLARRYGLLEERG